MRLTTYLYASFTSVGYPAKSIPMTHGTLGEIIKRLAYWLTTAPMGSRIDIRLARSEAELHTAKALSPLSPAESILDELGLAGLFDESSEESDHADTARHERSEAVITDSISEPTDSISGMTQIPSQATQPTSSIPTEPTDSESPSKIFNLKRLPE